MAITIGDQTNIDKSNLAAYPNGQIKDDSGTGNGTPINRVTASDIWEFFDKLMRLAAISFNGNFDNETNGYQYVQAAIALAGKNDYVYPITTVAGVLQIGVNLAILQAGEILIAQATQDLGAETTIKGSTATTKTISRTVAFKANDYLFLINNGGNIAIVVMTTADNFSALGLLNNFLKAATDADEDTGTSTSVATTPESGKYIFTKRVTDPTAAAPYFATPTTPGIMSAADKVTVNKFSNIKNIGWFSGVDAGGGTVGATYAVHGDVVSATISAVTSGPYYIASGVPVGSGTQIDVVLANAMASTSYKVNITIESTGTLINDSTVWIPIFRITSTTAFQIFIREGASQVQNLKIHIEAVQVI